MPGVDFNREAFVPAAERTQRPPAKMVGFVLFVGALAALAFLGYKFLSQSRESAPAVADAPTLENVQQQLARIEKRLDQLERRRKVSTNESDPASSDAAKAPVEKPTQKKTVYTFVPSGVKAQAQPAPAKADPQPGHAPTAAASQSDTSAADREAWEATTNRLADVVGVVGSQESEIAEAKQQLNTLLAQTRRNAIPFELHRGTSPQSVGPVSMLLKGSDPRSQRYSLCVYVD